jgi:hypothetical protein
MDPNATLAAIRELLASDTPDVIELAELMEALDMWLSRGGFLPTDWERS